VSNSRVCGSRWMELCRQCEREASGLKRVDGHPDEGLPHQHRGDDGARAELDHNPY
jgi:hypothetical protein